MTYQSIAQIKTANTDRGHFFFEPASLRFFRSRIGQTVHHGNFFITSEQFDGRSPRLHTIRYAHDTGEIDTVGLFQQFGSGAQAIRALDKAIKADAADGELDAPYWVIIHDRMLAAALESPDLSTYDRSKATSERAYLRKRYAEQ